MSEIINPNDLPHDQNTGKPIYPKAAQEKKLPEGTKHLPDGSKRLPDGKVIAAPSVVEGPPNPNDLEKDKDGKLTEKSQAIIAAYQAKNSPPPKPDIHAKPKAEAKGKDAKGKDAKGKDGKSDDEKPAA